MARVARAPKLDLASVLNSQNPQIDLRLDAFEVSTQNFLRAVSNYTQRALTEIANRKNVHLTTRKKLAEKAQAVEVETNQCKLKEIELIKVIDSELEERKEAETLVATFRRQLSAARDRCAALEGEVEQHRTLAADMSRERERERLLLESHAAKIAPELVHCADRLQCQIEGVDKDKILIRFLQLDTHNSNREFSLVLDVSSRSYKVSTMTPILPNLPIMLDDLNKNRDIYAFIKRIRVAYLVLIG
ncbi:hypothetical protein IEO21_03406 [Rhodonia placenta]|uniref:Kinetochore protein SPC25 n=1 Tax=Rhodonia placenta TaxID=104341 RepID=A0A8H7P5W5_9APHY|nr:hypothetical protein IEO21_03406 [Postia placenta]